MTSDLTCKKCGSSLKISDLLPNNECPFCTKQTSDGDFNEGWTKEDIEKAIARLSDAEKAEHAKRAAQQLQDRGGYFELGYNGKQRWIPKK